VTAGEHAREKRAREQAREVEDLDAGERQHVSGLQIALQS
jgi:hypothetical protein